MHELYHTVVTPNIYHSHTKYLPQTHLILFYQVEQNISTKQLAALNLRNLPHDAYCGTYKAQSEIYTDITL